MDASVLDLDGTSNNGNGGTQGNNGGSQEDITALNGGQEKQDINAGGSGEQGNQGNKGNGQEGVEGGQEGNQGNQGEGDDRNSSTGELTEGDQIELDGATYTVDKDGNLVDKDNKVFKKADEVAEWIKGFEQEKGGEDNKEFDIKSIQEALGVSIQDEEGKDVEFTNDVNGVKSYLNSVIDLKRNEIQEATLNKFYSDNPLVKQFVDYCQVMGTPRGFGEIPDRSGIQLDKDNEQQLEYVIRMAASEFGNKSLNDNYIKYLKSSGGLYDEAKNQLEALVQKDKDYRTQIEEQAKQTRLAEQQAITNYWTNVNKVIESGVIAGYKLPQSFIKEVNGTKVTLTTNDFYNYLSRQVETDAEGNRMTGYQKDLNSLTDEELLNRELLDAWLMFTGGSYKDLVNMAVNEEQVRKLRLKSKEQRNTKTIKITKANNGKTNMEDILL